MANQQLDNLNNEKYKILWDNDSITALYAITRNAAYMKQLMLYYHLPRDKIRDKIKCTHAVIYFIKHSMYRYFKLTLPKGFKHIPKYEDYAIDRYGKIIRIKNRLLLKVFLDKDGYYKCFLCAKHTLFVHRLVATTYIDNERGVCCVNHIDGVKVNNHTSNLEWVTVKENNVHAIETGLKLVRGVNNVHAKLTEEQVLIIRKSTLETTDIMKQFNMGRTSINEIRRGRTWKHLS